MIQQSKGKIFLADERGLTKLDWFKSYCTFNFGRYQSEHKKAFGNLYVFNEEMLAANRSIGYTIEEPTHIILIPVIGALEYKDSNGNKSLNLSGQVQFFTVAENTTVECRNPYKEEAVQFIQVWVRAGEENNGAVLSPQFEIDLDRDKNKIPAIINHENFSLSLGKFDGRAEAIYNSKNASNGVFAFVINGAFEVQHRLLHAGDGLALWELNEIEFEALSNDAIILITEVSVREEKP